MNRWDSRSFLRGNDGCVMGAGGNMGAADDEAKDGVMSTRIIINGLTMGVGIEGWNNDHFLQRNTGYRMGCRSEAIRCTKPIQIHRNVKRNPISRLMG